MKLSRITTLISLFFALFIGFQGLCQRDFFLPRDVYKDKIDFELINNLVVVPVTINGTPLTFLLDTGVKTTILFGLAQTDSVEMKNVSPIKIRGLGSGGNVEALRSDQNTFRIGKAIDRSHTIYIVFDESLNFSPRMGVPIHGILGYDFFSSFVVETNYSSKKLRIYNPDYYDKKSCNSCEVYDLTFYNDKPHAKFVLDGLKGTEEALLLIDSGSSDALWLFDEEMVVTEEPKNYFEDFLGLGLSGNIYGKRSRIEELSIGEWDLEDVNTAIPDEAALGGFRMLVGRKGSLGGNVLKRFHVVMNYQAKQMILKKNSQFNEPFYYNMSGLTLEHGNVDLVESNKKVINNPLSYSESDVNKFAFGIIRTSEFSFRLAPAVVVAEVREGSPADLAGIYKGDEIKMINGKNAHEYELYELIDLFSSKVGRRINMEIERNGITMKKQFVLKKLI